MLQFRLQRVIDRTRQPPPTRIDDEVKERSSRREDLLRCQRTVRAGGRVEAELRRAGRSLLADVVGIVDGQMGAVTAYISDLRNGFSSKLFFQGQVPELHVRRILLSWCPEREGHVAVDRKRSGDRLWIG